MNAPQLTRGTNDYGQDCWKLWHHEGPVSVCLEIRYYHGGNDDPNHYRVLAAHEDEYRNANSHGYREVITPEELQDRVDNCEAHEGTKEAQRWLKENVPDRFLVAGKYNKIHRMANQLKGRWEALLQIIHPSVTF